MCVSVWASVKCFLMVNTFNTVSLTSHAGLHAPCSPGFFMWEWWHAVSPVCHLILLYCSGGGGGVWCDWHPILMTRFHWPRADNRELPLSLLITHKTQMQACTKTHARTGSHTFSHTHTDAGAHAHVHAHAHTHTHTALARELLPIATFRLTNKQREHESIQMQPPNESPTLLESLFSFRHCRKPLSCPTCASRIYIALY